jgi:catechol 2,3-dioxygenase-like lactoylglutathione lyase family enzyme
MMEMIMDKIHHVAIQVQDIQRAVDWYTTHFQCRVSYLDATWAMLDFDNVQLALVVPAQHPFHVAFSSDNAASFGKLTVHRDGVASTYQKDSEGNTIEILDASSLKKS